MFHNQAILILLILGMAFPTGCENTNLNEEISYPELSHHSEDSLITANLKARLLRDPELKGRTIQIETTNGTVHLNGLVSNKFEAQQAEHIAREIPGVVSVQNNLRITLSR